MLGYVQVYKPELKIREYEIYKGYYCGICKYIGKEYGQIPRLALSYDAAFLALLLSSVLAEPESVDYQQCIAHHIEKRPVIFNNAVEFSGDVMLILAWHKIQDDINDEGKFSARFFSIHYKKIYENLYRKHRRLCKGVEHYLQELTKLEKSNCPSLDQVAETFAKIMSIIFIEGFRFLHEKSLNPVYHNCEAAAKLGYHLGKWIYLMDAACDIEENIEDGAYNPLLIRHQYDPSSETAEEFKARIADNLEFNLYQYLAVISQVYKEIDIKKNIGIIENIIFFGLNRKTEKILKGEVDESI